LNKVTSLQIVSRENLFLFRSLFKFLSEFKLTDITQV